MGEKSLVPFGVDGFAAIFLSFVLVAAVHVYHHIVEQCCQRRERCYNVGISGRAQCAAYPQNGLGL